ncbi:hypothetical protein BDB01DRAFT_805955 [Pilobolus umbonatus]|nr:hypothetical protein BDB01DRAFT_805955 [Pilobolus umbonatus]
MHCQSLSSLFLPELIIDTYKGNNSSYFGKNYDYPLDFILILTHKLKLALFSAYRASSA